MKQAARIACLAALAAASMALGAGNARAANLQLPIVRTEIEVSFAPSLTGWLLSELPAAIETTGARDAADARAAVPSGANPADLPVLPDRPASEGIGVLILGVIVAGLVWRYLQSPEYGRLYDRLYGPLSGY